ncbi:MAG: hypothetical protein FRX49_08354 [Trebouxia sp. A1-2]|nr:MAG: hypothetical protein FRX49_08354 [Trebouxia sp. A1-2]
MTNHGQQQEDSPNDAVDEHGQQQQEADKLLQELEQCSADTLLPGRHQKAAVRAEIVSLMVLDVARLSWKAVKSVASVWGFVSAPVIKASTAKSRLSNSTYDFCSHKHWFMTRSIQALFGKSTGTQLSTCLTAIKGEGLGGRVACGLTGEVSDEERQLVPVQLPSSAHQPAGLWAVLMHLQQAQKAKVISWRRGAGALQECGCIGDVAHVRKARVAAEMTQLAAVT